MKDVEDIYELSPMQHGMLYDSVVAGDSGMYLIQLEYFLEGVLRVSEFERAWQQTLSNHGILRTSFHWDGLEKPLQVVHKGVELSLPYQDWSGLPSDEQERQAASFREEDRRRGFDFGDAPLLRLGLFRTGTDSHRLLWSFHHILMEGWSAAIVSDEVLARYRSQVHSESLQPPEHRPYRDFVAWLQQQDLARAEAWWRESLAGVQNPTHLGIDRAPPGLRAPATEYDERTLRLSVVATSALQSFAQGHELTLNTLFQGAWALLLSRYSGDEDVLFGSVVSGRSAPLPGIETMVGLFVNNLPTRVRVPPGERLAPWRQQLQARQVREREFECSSLVQVKGWSEFPAGMPLFESLLVFENWQGDLAEGDWGAGLELRDETEARRRERRRDCA